MWAWQTVESQGGSPPPHSFRKIFHRVMSRGNLLSQPSSDTNRKGENTFIDHWPRESIHSPPVWAIKDLIYHDTICPHKITQDLKIDLKIQNQLWLPIMVCIIPDLMSSVSIVRSERSHLLIEKLQGLSLMFWYIWKYLCQSTYSHSWRRRILIIMKLGENCLTVSTGRKIKSSYRHLWISLTNI